MDYISKIKNFLSEKQLKNLEDIKCIIKQRMNETLYEHSTRTMDFSVMLALKHYQDFFTAKTVTAGKRKKPGSEFFNRVCLSSLLHDYGKILEKDELTEILSRHIKGLSDFEKNFYPCMHGYAAPYLIKRDFGIEDEEIYNAISRHTTGSCRMGIIDRIVYISDKLEEGRNYKNIDYLRELSISNPDMCLLEVYKSNIIYVISKNCILHPDTGRIWNYIFGGYKYVT